MGNKDDLPRRQYERAMRDVSRMLREAKHAEQAPVADVTARYDLDKRVAFWQRRPAL
jgi:hypothetical protein